MSTKEKMFKLKMNHLKFNNKKDLLKNIKEFQKVKVQMTEMVLVQITSRI